MSEPTGLDYEAAYAALYPGLHETVRLRDVNDRTLKTIDRAARLRLSERERVKSAIAELHVPFGIYTECGHEHTDEQLDAGDCMEIEEVGLTCEDGLMYRICTACCLGGSTYQPEHCADAHEHTKTGPVCPTTAALEEIR